MAQQQPSHYCKTSILFTLASRFSPIAFNCISFSGSSLDRIIADIVALHNPQLPRLLAYLQPLWGSADTPEILSKAALFFLIFLVVLSNS